MGFSPHPTFWTPLKHSSITSGGQGGGISPILSLGKAVASAWLKIEDTQLQTQLQQGLEWGIFPPHPLDMMALPPPFSGDIPHSQLWLCWVETGIFHPLQRAGEIPQVVSSKLNHPNN